MVTIEAPQHDVPAMTTEGPAPVPALGAAVGWALPASVLTAAAQQFETRPNEVGCPQCHGALFERKTIVRLKQGYSDGLKRVVLLVCVRCNHCLNPEELLDA